MSPTATDAARRRGTRIEEERRARPESEVWLRLLALALDTAEKPPWAGVTPRLAPGRQPDAPLLHDAFVPVDPRAAARWVRRLLTTAAASRESPAASLAGLLRTPVDAVEMLAAAIAGDGETLDAMARAAGADSAALRAVAPLVALPLLRGCADALASQHPVGWARGYCPVCGGLPALAELRGLERTRVLRCGRCAAAWELPVLVCPFCDEREHDRQLSFAAEGKEQRQRVDACRSCHGYVKTITTLAPIPAWAVPLEDLATLELDLVAADRELRRPEASPFPALVRLAADGGVLSRLRGGWA